MSFSPDNHHDELGELGRKAQLIRSQLREGGPDVNIEHLYYYIADTLSASVRKEVRERIYTWRDWFNAYWQLSAELNFCEAALDDAALAGGLESSTDFLGQAQDESSEPSEYLADEAARYLQLEYEELLDEFSVFAGSVRSDDLLGAYREKLREIVCVDWNWSRQKNDPRWNDPRQLVGQLLRLFEEHKMMLGLPHEALPIVAAILVQEGLDHFCKLGE